MTECPHCSRKFKDIKEYAQHIIDKHSFDVVRLDWANEVLGKKKFEQDKGPEVVEGSVQAKTGGGPMETKPKVQASNVVGTVKKIFRSPATIMAVIALLASIYSLATVRNVYYGEIATLKTTVASLQSSSTTHDSNIATLITKDNELTAAQVALSSAYSALSETYATLVSNLSSLAANVSNLTSLVGNITFNGTLPYVRVAQVTSSTVTLGLHDLFDERLYVLVYGLNVSDVVANISISNITQKVLAYVNSTDFDTMFLVKIAPATNWTGVNSVVLTVTGDLTVFADAWMTES